MTENTVTVAPGVKRTELDECYLLRGKRHAVIAAGLAQPDWFADGTEIISKNGRADRHKDLEIDGRTVRTHIEKTTERVRVYISYTDAERKANEARAAAEPRDRELMARRAVLPDGWNIVDDMRGLGELVGALSDTTPARFDVVVLYAPGYETDGITVEIVHAFGFLPMIDARGRKRHRFGYYAKALGGKAFFAPAWMLRDAKGCVRHIRSIDRVPQKRLQLVK